MGSGKGKKKMVGRGCFLSKPIISSLNWGDNKGGRGI